MNSHDPATLNVTPIENFPRPETWDNVELLEAKAWPRREKKSYMLVPTTCFNCEAACGLVAYVDKQDLSIKKFEGNPFHPGSRGRNCAKGPATLNQVNDTGRVLYPMKRVGPRGSGKWERVSWDHVLDTFAARIRRALVEGRKTEVMYHVGRPGHDGYMDRVLQSWGVDGHNSHTNVCSGAARRLGAVADSPGSGDVLAPPGHIAVPDRAESMLDRPVICGSQLFGSASSSPKSSPIPLSATEVRSSRWL